jgi:hypothetical protein
VLAGVSVGFSSFSAYGFSFFQTERHATATRLRTDRLRSKGWGKRQQIRRQGYLQSIANLPVAFFTLQGVRMKRFMAACFCDPEPESRRESIGLLTIGNRRLRRQLTGLYGGVRCERCCSLL